MKNKLLRKVTLFLTALIVLSFLPISGFVRTVNANLSLYEEANEQDSLKDDELEDQHIFQFPNEVNKDIENEYSHFSFVGSEFQGFEWVQYM